MGLERERESFRVPRPDLRFAPYDRHHTLVVHVDALRGEQEVPAGVELQREEGPQPDENGEMESAAAR